MSNAQVKQLLQNLPIARMTCNLPMQCKIFFNKQDSLRFKGKVQVQVQDAPTTLDTQTNQPIGQKWELPEWFQHYACLYLKNCNKPMINSYILKSVFSQNQSYNHPCFACASQNNLLLQELIKFKSRATSDLVHLDDLLVDLKYDSNILQIPIPRYFRKADTIPVQMTFREEVTDKKKKKGKGGKGGKGKKGKKGKGAAAEKKEQSDDQKDKLTKEQRLQLLEKKLGEVKQMDNHSIIDFNFFFSIRLIQKSQRGRQYRHRILEIIQWKKTNDRNNQMAVRVAQGEDRSHVTTDEERQKLAAVYVQKQLRGILARKRVNDLRQEELIFLGMAPRVKSKDQDEQDPIAKMERIKKERRKKQNQHWLEYQIALDDMHEFIKGKQGPDIKEDQLNERRQWIIQETQKNQNDPPDDIKDFYKRNQVEMPLSPEQEQEKKLKEEQQAKAAAAASKKKKDDKGKDKKGGKKKKKGAQEDFDPLKNLVLTGPPELIQKFQQMYQNYADTWQNRDESNNFQQKYDSDMVKQDVRPAVEKQLEKEVDAMMAFELEHLKFELGLKKGKKKKGKKKKGKKKKGGKKKKQPPGMKQASKLTPYQLLMQLEQNGIARRYGKQKIKQFIGDFNYLGSMLDNPLEESPDPSMAQIRQNVTEFCVFPLGSQLVKQQSQLIKSVLFYGPSGTGKTMMMRAICHETSSLLLDLSPHTTIGKYSQRKGEQLLVASCFRVAQQYQPAIIYIDECQLVFPTAKKGKGKAKKKKKGGANDPGRIKKALLAYKKTFLNKDLRILIVGCTNNPGQAKTAQLRTFFDKKIYFPYPNYPTRLMMWKNSIQQNGGKITPQFPLSTLTYISEGYPAGSIQEATKQVLTKYRIQNVNFCDFQYQSQIDTKPLQIQQFIGPLSLTDYTFIDEYKTFRDFTGDITLDKARITAIKAKDKKGDEDEGGKKDKKAGKKKKK